MDAANNWDGEEDEDEDEDEEDTLVYGEALTAFQSIPDAAQLMLLRANVNRLFWEATLACPEGMSLSNDDADGEIPADGAANYASMYKAAEDELLRYVWNFPTVALSDRFGRFCDTGF